MDAISKISEFQKFGWVLGLERMNVLLEKLGNPHEDLKVLHVAGTNGKGSVCRYLYEILQAAGYRCGLFTSPFLEVFNERIEFDGSFISDADLQRCSDVVLAMTEEMVAEGHESPTEFEVITAVAFLYFKEKNTDFVVLEVGLGGRGDSTNVVKRPLCSIITSISLDHTDRLGETIEEIAAEKAGIIKEGCPVITGVENEEAMWVLKHKAIEKHTPIFDALQSPFEILEETVEGTRVRAEVLKETYEFTISMVGRHQVQNALTALTAIALLNKRGDFTVTDEQIAEGFKRAKQIGRFEIMEKEPFVILDGAHNPGGAKALKETVLRHFKDKKILMVTGILADKEVEEVLDSFMDITKDFIATEPDNPRKLPAEELAEKMQKRGGHVHCFSKAEEAVSCAQGLYEAYDVILFTGSLYLIGKIRGLINEKGVRET
ncbi:bifunctional folylpolyglutamate synthase/dihydrofolate synthase [Anaerotruncus sp. 80]|uniref:tetrahydrofolate synthase n=1 Tax=Anaerotruncus colihominis TaxID=169435 RepID=A0A845QLI5_9FIRM|nr:MULTISPECIES: folylpolyglutamate synthase/dihydrofolate synthase family protein [Anaerotruncus]NBH61965.1 bifunctional folylpolyglutamate synthase/dihydrofolate synthase [Anaerotruncus colihominis]NCF02620.1 bifunctional folylpolyglutamate synthase/dihydrofolate synthase [Anaerotruncus sp. 80]